MASSRIGTHLFSKVFGFWLAVLYLCGCVTEIRADSASQPMILRDVSYGPLAEENADLCIPADSGHVHPGVILIHGGAWAKGDKKTYDKLCKALAGRGIVAMSVNYRLGNRDDPNGAPWPAQLVDVQLAVRWLRAHALTYGFDTKRLCSWGDSAGGHLAVFLGVRHDIAAASEGDKTPQLYSDQATDVRCVVDGFGPVDFFDGAYSSGATHRLNPGLFHGATPATAPELFRQASPIYYVTPQSAAMLTVHGYQDKRVPVTQTQELVATLRKNGVHVETIFYQGEHAYRTVFVEDSPSPLIPDYNDIIQKEIDFVTTQLQP